MKCTNITEKLLELKELERRELVKTLQAHGGSYAFFDCYQENAEEVWEELEARSDFYDIIPEMTGALQFWDKEGRFYVTRCKINDKWSQEVEVYGIWEENFDLEEEQLVEYYNAGELSAVTALIPATEDIKDVTEYPQFYPVQELSKEDLEHVGYDPNISDEDFAQVAAYVAKRISLDDFWETLRWACMYHEVKPLKDDDDE